MMSVRSLGSSALSLALSLAVSACGGDDGGDGAEPTHDAGPRGDTSQDAAAGSGAMDAAAPPDPFAGIINSLLGDAGLSGITSLFGDAGLSGITGLFGDAGFAGFLDGGFDPAAVCARVPQLCPDGGFTPRDAGVDAGDGGAVEAGSPDAAVDASDPEAGALGDAGGDDGGGADAGS